MHITRIGFMIELTLYGQMNGMPIVRMSVWPCDLDEVLARRRSRW